MYQNIKVDVVYYRTNTDFEMEFNLCGCCRMRLLTEKAADRNSLVHALSRAVSRSRIILVCGSLFGEDGLISSVARLVKKPLVTADTAAYGLDNSTELKIIEGATPLVSADGLFGGCIIESGPQSIILLTENKNVRKSLMENLIHSYIADVSMIPENPEQSPQETPELPVEEAAEEEPVAEEIDAEEPIEESSEEPEDITAEETVSEEPEPTEESLEKAESEEPATAEEPTESITEEPFEKEETVPLLYLSDEDQDGNPDLLERSFLLHKERQQARKSRRAYTDGNYTLSEKEDYFCGEDGLDSSGKPIFRLPILILTVVLLVALAALAYLLIYLPLHDGVSLKEYLHTIFSLNARVLPVFKL